VIFSVVFPQNVEYSSGVSILQIDHRTAHISQKNRSSPKFNTTALGHSNDRQFDDVAIEEMLSQLSWVFEGDNERALRDG
jgi:hypothetical protein